LLSAAPPYSLSCYYLDFKKSNYYAKIVLLTPLSIVPS
jgi:hypothetical protein